MLGIQSGINVIGAMVYPTSLRANGSGWELGIGRIGSIVIHIPWRALRSEPVRITVDRVYLLISPIDEFAQRDMVASSASSLSSFDELTEAHLRRQRFFKQSKIAAAELVRQERQRSESESSSSAVAATSAGKQCRG